MKRLRRRNIMTAVEPAINPGTIYYRVTEDALKDVLDKSDNFIFRYLVNTKGLNCFDLEDNLLGSMIIDNDLYICQTDGKDISVADTEVDPYDALDMYSIEELSDYIVDADEDIIKSKLTEYELQPIDVNKVCSDMIRNHGYNFIATVVSAKDMGLLDNII